MEYQSKSKILNYQDQQEEGLYAVPRSNLLYSKELANAVDHRKIYRPHLYIEGTWKGPFL